MFFRFLMRVFAFIVFLVASLATFLSGLGVYYKEPGFTLAETLAYAFLAIASIALIFFKKEKKCKSSIRILGRRNSGNGS